VSLLKYGIGTVDVFVKTEWMGASAEIVVSNLNGDPVMLPCVRWANILHGCW
jgi:hypothetical protein